MKTKISSFESIFFEKYIKPFFEVELIFNLFKIEDHKIVLQSVSK